MMFWSGLSPYNMEYVETRHIYFLYSPIFSVVFAPIFLLPEWLGPYVWNVFNYCMFTLAIWMLPNQLAPHRLKIFLFLLSTLLQSIFCFQYNTVVCYIFLFAFILLERDKPFFAILLIMFSAMTKIWNCRIGTTSLLSKILEKYNLCINMRNNTLSTSCYKSVF